MIFQDFIAFVNYLLPFNFVMKKSDVLKLQDAHVLDNSIIIATFVPKVLLTFAIGHLIVSDSNKVMGMRAKQFWPIFLLFIMI